MLHSRWNKWKKKHKPKKHQSIKSRRTPLIMEIIFSRFTRTTFSHRWKTNRKECFFFLIWNTLENRKSYEINVFEWYNKRALTRRGQRLFHESSWCMTRWHTSTSLAFHCPNLSYVTCNRNEQETDLILDKVQEKKVPGCSYDSQFRQCTYYQTLKNKHKPSWSNF